MANRSRRVATWQQLVCALGLTSLAGLVLVLMLNNSSPADGQQARESVKVGIMHSLTGTFAITEVSLRDAELTAIEEINAAGGVLGRKIEPLVEDTKSQGDTVFPEKAKKLLLSDKVAVVFGCWASFTRKNVLPIFEKYDGLLFYPAAYEGNECSKNVVYTGAVPNQQIIPAVDYLWEKMGKRKFYLLGSDYIYPRTVNQLIVAYLQSKYKVQPVAEQYTPLGYQDYKNVVADIKAKKPDVIFSTINGDSNINFYKELAAAGITPDMIPVCAALVAEDELRGLDPKLLPTFKGHLCAGNYFQSVDTPANKKFVANFKKFVKDDKRVTDDAIAAAYTQAYLWKAAVEKAKSFDVDQVRRALKDLEIDAPEGKIKVDGKNFHTWKTFRMGKIRADGRFDIVYTSPNWIRPDPYPPVMFKKDCDWTKGGIIKRE